MSDRVIEWTIAVLFAFIALILAYTMFGVLPLVVRADLACQRAGYRSSIVSVTRVVFCVKRVNGTDIVVPFEQR